MLRNLLFSCAFLPLLVMGQEQAPVAPPDIQLPVGGRVIDGANKLAGCEVILYKDNERISSLTTDKSGKFSVNLDMNASWGITFQKEGYVAKRMVFDTHLPKVKEDAELVIEPMVMEVGMLPASKYEGANTDDLDFPFAIVKWNRTVGTFTQDPEYTMGMQRLNGALLLMSARTDKH
jgi:hypothetical protein